MPYKYIKTESLNHHDFLKGLNGFINEFHKDLMISHYAGHEKLVWKQSNTKVKDLKIGQRVLIWKPSTENGKLSLFYSGPFEVSRQLFVDTYELKCKDW